MEWLTLDQNGKEGLLVIMNRSLVPIEFSCAYILTMNLDSFVSVSISNHCHVKNATIVFRKVNKKYAYKIFLMHIFFLNYTMLNYCFTYKNQFFYNILIIIMTVIIRILVNILRKREKKGKSI